jgi:hypothetical protein
MLIMKKIVLLLAACLLMGSFSFAQGDLMDLLESEEEETTDYAIATFKTTRLVNGHSIEMPSHGVLQMLISHRFGRLNEGFYDLWGLDRANIRIGLEYGVTPWLTLGFGRSNVLKTYDGFAKFRLLRQSTGKRNMPISVTALSSIALQATRPDTLREEFFTSRLDYTFQLMIARKFSEKLSFQLMPTVVHRNLVPTVDENNDVPSIGLGGRFKLSKSVTLNAEYYYIIPGFLPEESPFTNALAFGIDIETGGHVFQLVMSNSRFMTTNLFARQTDGNWLNGDIHLGFAISRVFTVHRPE